MIIFILGAEPLRQFLIVGGCDAEAVPAMQLLQHSLGGREPFDGIGAFQNFVDQQKAGFGPGGVGNPL